VDGGDEVVVLVVSGAVTPGDKVEVDGVTDGGYQWICVWVCCVENSFTIGTWLVVFCDMGSVLNYFVDTN
jgi:hypothetical protein